MTAPFQDLPPGSEQSPGQIFTKLGELLYEGERFEHAYDAVCRAACHLVPACDHASVLLLGPHGWTTKGASDDIARQVDELQRQVGSGPCLDAIVDHSPQLAPDLGSTPSPWPAFREQIVATTPVRSMLAFRIVSHRRKLGALNLLSDHADEFGPGAVDQASILAAFLSVAAQAAWDRQEAETLRQGLHSNRVIGEAVGLLMAYHKVDADRAFAVLKAASNELNLKLNVVAERVIRGHQDQLSTE